MARNRPGVPVSEEDAKAALVLAAQIGTRAASRELGHSATSITNWKRRYPQFWSNLIGETTTEQVAERLANRVDEIADLYADVEVEAIDRAAKLLPRADGKETAALLKAISQGRTTAVSTSGRLRGEPDERHEHTISFTQLENALARFEELAAPSAPELPEYVENEA